MDTDIEYRLRECEDRIRALESLLQSIYAAMVQNGQTLNLLTQAGNS